MIRVRLSDLNGSQRLEKMSEHEMTKTGMRLQRKKKNDLPKIQNVSHGHFPLIRNPYTRSKMYQPIIPDNSRPIAPEITWINAPKPKCFMFFPEKSGKHAYFLPFQDTK